MLKKILFIIGFIILFLAVYFFFMKPKKINLTTVKKSYSNVSLFEENDSYNIQIYINQKNSYITDKDKISSIYISDKEEDNQIKMDLLNLIYVGKSKIDEKTYYIYNYNIKPLLINHDDIEIDNAYLIINYHNFKNVKIHIGSFSSYKVENFNKSDLGISRLKGIVNTINNKKTLVGLALELNNESSKNIDIIGIRFFDPNIKVGDYKLSDFSMILSNSNLSDHLGYQYNINNTFNNEIDFKLNEKDTLLISLMYENHYKIADLGFQIIYKIDQEEFVYNYDKFHFFTDYENIVFIDELTFYTYEHD